MQSWLETQLLLIFRLLVLGKASASFHPHPWWIFLEGSSSPLNPMHAPVRTDGHTDTERDAQQDHPSHSSGPLCHMAPSCPHSWSLAPTMRRFFPSCSFLKSDRTMTVSPTPSDLPSNRISVLPWPSISITSTPHHFSRQGQQPGGLSPHPCPVPTSEL